MELFLFQNYPRQTVSYFLRLLLFGGAGSTIASIYIIFALMHTWEEISWSNTIFRVFHFVRLLITAIQLPIRIFMVMKIYEAGQQTHTPEVIDLLVKLTAHRVWEWNRQLGVAIYICFFSGVALLFSKFIFLSPSPHLLYCLLGNIFIFFTHMFFSYIGIREILQDDGAFDQTIKAGGADQETIKNNTRVYSWSTARSMLENGAKKEKQTSDDEEEHECPICFGEYNQTDFVRVLKCGHLYHTKCIDEWLQKKDICPTCTAKIVKPAPAHVEAMFFSGPSESYITPSEQADEDEFNRKTLHTLLARLSAQSADSNSIRAIRVMFETLLHDPQRVEFFQRETELAALFQEQIDELIRRERDLEGEIAETITETITEVELIEENDNQDDSEKEEQDEQLSRRVPHSN